MKLALSLLALVYLLSPYDIIPDVFAGWGWIDDLAILYFLWRYFYRGKGKSFSQWRTAGRSNEKTGGSGSRPTSGSKSKDPYDVLQISKGASQEEIKIAYKQLAGKYHPDKVLHLGEEFQRLAEERFKEIQAAYQELSANGGKDGL
jgi:uncharacterized membrane protein YkvA (DUF1232 family)